MAHEFIAKKGFISQGNAQVSGSLTVSGGISGSISGLHIGNTIGTSSWANTASYMTASSIIMEKIGNSTYSTVQHLQDIFHSAGWIKGGEITTGNTSGSFNVNSGSGLIRSLNSSLSTIYWFDWPSSNFTASNNKNVEVYVYVNYNAGSPIVTTSSISPETDYQSNVLLGVLFWSSGSNYSEFHINTTVKETVADHAKQMIRFNKAVMPYAVESGGILTDAGHLGLAVSAGAFWEGLNRFTTNAINTSGSSTNRFSYYWNSGSNWFETGSLHYINPSLYNNITNGTLVSMTVNRYKSDWVFLGVDSDLYVVYGQNQYNNLANAQNEGIPSSLPPEILTDGFLIGRIIVQSGATELTQVDSVFTTMLQSSVPTEHNSLIGLQGGSSNEYYHLTSAEYVGTGTGNFVRTSSPTITGLNATGSLLGTSSWANNALTSIQSNFATSSISSSYLSGSYAYVNQLTSSNGILNNGSLTVNGDLYVFGSASFFSASNVYITSSHLVVSDNIITINAFSPYQRYAGFEMYDSGSGTTTYMLWDSQNNYYFVSSSDANYSRQIILGPDNESELIAGYLTVASSSNNISNSAVFQLGSNIGIGTATPQALLHVQGNITASSITASLFGSSSYSLTASYFGLGTNQYVPKWNGNTLTSTSPIYIDSNNNIGIGTITDINSKVLVVGPSSITGTFSVGASSGELTASVFSVLRDTAPFLKALDIFRNGEMMLSASSTPEKLLSAASNGVMKFSVTKVGGVFASSFTGSLLGTASWSNNALTASYIGSGTNNYLPKWNNNTLTSTSSFIDSGSNAKIKLNGSELLSITAWSASYLLGAYSSLAKINNRTININFVSNNYTSPTCSFWKIATLPSSSASTFDYTTITAKLGSWTNINKGIITCILSNRGSTTGSLLLQSWKYEGASTTLPTTVGIECYRSSSDGVPYYGGIVDVYLVFSSSAYDQASIDVSGHRLAGDFSDTFNTIIYDPPLHIFTPDSASGVKIFDTKDTATYPPRLNIFAGQLYGTSSWANNSLTSVQSNFTTQSLFSTQSSFATSASFASSSITSSYTLTASYIGVGTNNYIPKWNNNTLTSTSSIYDSGTGVGIGTTNPVADKLKILHTPSYLDGNSASLSITTTPAFSSSTSANNASINVLMQLNVEDRNSVSQVQSIFNQLAINTTGSYRGTYKACRNSILVSQPANLTQFVAATYNTIQLLNYSNSVVNIPVIYGVSDTIAEAGTPAGILTGSIGNLIHYNATTPSFTSPALWITRSTGVYIERQSGSYISQSYGIYQAGAGDENYFVGNIGVGIDHPLARVHIVQTGTGDAFRVDDQANDVSYFIVDSSGNVAICTGSATATTNAKLTLYGGGIYIDRQDVTNSASLAHLLMYRVSGSTSIIGAMGIDQTTNGLNPNLIIGATLGTANNVAIMSGEGAGNASQLERMGFTDENLYLCSDAKIVFVTNTQNLSTDGEYYPMIIGSTGTVNLTYGNKTVTAPSDSYLMFLSGSDNRALLYAKSPSAASAFFVSGSGNIGVGTTTPSAKIDINTTGEGSELLRLSSERAWTFRQTGSGITTALELKDLNGSKNFNIVGYDNSITAQFKNTGETSPDNNRIILLPEQGKVGVGTTNPLAKLNVSTGSTASSGDHLVEFSSGGSKRVLHFTNIPSAYYNSMARDGDSGIIFASSSIDNSQGFFIAPWSSNGSGLRINALGNVGIGTSNPSYRLQITTGSTNSTLMYLSNDGGFNQLIIGAGNGGITDLGMGSGSNGYVGTNNSYPFSIRTGASNRIWVDRSGSVGIGNSSPQALLHVQGNISASNITATNILSGSSLNIYKDIYPISSSMDPSASVYGPEYSMTVRNVFQYPGYAYGFPIGSLTPQPYSTSSDGWGNLLTIKGTDVTSQLLFEGNGVFPANATRIFYRTKFYTNEFSSFKQIQFTDGTDAYGSWNITASFVESSSYSTTSSYATSASYSVSSSHSDVVDYLSLSASTLKIGQNTSEFVTTPDYIDNTIKIGNYLYGSTTVNSVSSSVIIGNNAATFTIQNKDNSVIIGESAALQAIGNGKNSIVIGREAIYLSGADHSNTIIQGYQAAYGVGTEISNSIVQGYQAAYALDTADGAVIQGSEAAKNLVFGNESIIVGLNAAKNARDVTEAVILGSNAGSSLVEGSGSIIIGRGALQTSVSGSDVIIIGRNISNITTSSLLNNVICIGNSNILSNPNTMTLGYDQIYNTIIYGQISASSITASLYGSSSYAISASYAPGSPSLSASYAETSSYTLSASYAPSSPSIYSISSSWASSSLTSLSSSYIGLGTSNYLPKWSDNNTLTSTSSIYDNETGVGIGTTLPQALLHVQGNISASNITSSNTLDISPTAPSNPLTGKMWYDLSDNSQATPSSSYAITASYLNNNQGFATNTMAIAYAIALG